MCLGVVVVNPVLYRMCFGVRTYIFFEHGVNPVIGKPRRGFAVMALLARCSGQDVEDTGNKGWEIQDDSISTVNSWL